MASSRPTPGAARGGDIEIRSILAGCWRRSDQGHQGRTRGPATLPEVPRGDERQPTTTSGRRCASPGASVRVDIIFNDARQTLVVGAGQMAGWAVNVAVMKARES
jgi:hypothetical protein